MKLCAATTHSRSQALPSWETSSVKKSSHFLWALIRFCKSLRGKCWLNESAKGPNYLRSLSNCRETEGFHFNKFCFLFIRLHNCVISYLLKKIGFSWLKYLNSFMKELSISKLKFQDFLSFRPILGRFSHFWGSISSSRR